MPEFEVPLTDEDKADDNDKVYFSFEAYCKECGSGICHTVEVTTTKNRKEPCIIIEPCPKCIKSLEVDIKDAYKNGKDDGYKDGWNDCLSYHSIQE